MDVLARKTHRGKQGQKSLTECSAMQTYYLKIAGFVTFMTLLVQIQEEEHLFTDSCNKRRKQTRYL